MHMGVWWGNLWERDHLEDTDVLRIVKDLVGTAVAQLVEALRYKPEGREFDSRWCHWNFSLT